MIIKAKKTLYNLGVCFTKGKTYETASKWGPQYNEASLMEQATINDLGERHIIGEWWRHFKIVKQ